jgi:hypothetical protein
MTGGLLEQLHAAWLRLYRRSKYSHVRNVRSMGDVPKRLGASIYLVGAEGVPKWAVMACPCRCGARIDVKLMRARQPHWKIRLQSGTVTLWPSLCRSAKTCGSHFFIERNRVLWVTDQHGHTPTAIQ